jgi:hypothetical protein
VSGGSQDVGVPKDCDMEIEEAHQVGVGDMKIETESLELDREESGPNLRSKKGSRVKDGPKSETPISDIVVEETNCNKENNKNLENLQENYF